MNIKPGILNLQTRYLSRLGNLICPDAEYLRCAVPHKKKHLLQEALCSPQRLLTVKEMLTADYMVSLQQLKLDEFSKLTGLLFLDEFVCKIELEEADLVLCDGFSFTQHRHNPNEAQLIITKKNFGELLSICEKISYEEVERLVCARPDYEHRQAA